MNNREYVEIILRDETERIVRETPTVYENARIVREYEFKDGAIVEYEWRDVAMGEFNHRFTLVQTPTPNPGKLKKGVIETINY
ncbi:MAG: hypothetical protein HOP17_12330 [Acidobacteria bacterium]|nr:hypothetical protein [Acidobacteriota bacterium]